MEVKLVVAAGPAKGRVIPLPATVFTIGRGTKCHLRPHSLAVSKLHCAIARWAGKVVVRDLNSANGTFVNDLRIQGEVRIRDGDTLRIGMLSFTFGIKTDPSEVLPVQVVREGDVKWLMDSPSGPLTLNTSETQLVDLAQVLGEADSGLARVGGPGDSGTLSAGEHLHDYLRQRKC